MGLLSINVSCRPSQELEMLTGNGHATTEASKMGQQMAKKIWENRHYLVIGWVLLALIMAPFAYELAAGRGELHILHIFW